MNDRRSALLVGVLAYRRGACRVQDLLDLARDLCSDKRLTVVIGVLHRRCPRGGAYGAEVRDYAELGLRDVQMWVGDDC